MIVETYEVDEVGAEHPEVSDEAVRLVAELGLSGQRKFTEPDGDLKLKTRAPYREVTAEEMFVIKMLCPIEVDLEKYDRAPIPIRVLQVAAHAKDCGMFTKLVVRCPRSESDRDPFLLGLDKETYSSKRFILARWADDVDEWPALVKKALSKWKEKALATCRQAIATAETDIRLIEAGAVTIERAGDKSEGVNYYGLSAAF